MAARNYICIELLSKFVQHRRGMKITNNTAKKNIQGNPIGFPWWRAKLVDVDEDKLWMAFYPRLWISCGCR